MTPLIFDAHLDLAWNAMAYDRDLTRPVEAMRQAEAHMTDDRCRGHATVSFPEMRRGGVGLCVGTLLARSGPDLKFPEAGYARTAIDHGTPWAAHAIAAGQLACYGWLERAGEIRILRTAADLAASAEAWRTSDGTEPIGLILSMEGADPIVAPEDLRAWFDGGLRIIGLAHYGMSRYAGGTDQHAGLTPLGHALLESMAELGVTLDVTHLCDRSLDEAIDTFGGRVLASHHNCRTLTPGVRQLTDEHLKKLIDREAVIGASMDAWMLHAGWETGKTPRETVSLEAAAIHIDHVCQLAGDACHSAIGSDLDGGFGSERTPHDLETIADLFRVGEHLAARGYNDTDINRIFCGNWLRFFAETLPGEINT